MVISRYSNTIPLSGISPNLLNIAINAEDLKKMMLIL